MLFCRVNVSLWYEDEKKSQTHRGGKNNPVNCATAENDIKELEKEKANVGEQIFAGLTSIAPPALVMGILTGTETSKIKVALGTYDKLIDARIKKIKETCNNE